MSSWYLFVVIMVALIIGGVVAIPIKVYLFRIVERQGNDVKVTEHIYLSRQEQGKLFINDVKNFSMSGIQNMRQTAE